MQGTAEQSQHIRGCTSAFAWASCIAAAAALGHV